jgi:two-component system, OmpR family, response regulator ChvI
MSIVRIMLVDDEPDIVGVFKKGLESKGFQVDVFIDPEEALEQFKPNLYDCIVTDINMPKMNGFQLYRKIKDQDNKVRVIFLTAFDIFEQEAKLVFPDIDPKSFIKKPVSIDDLAERLKQETTWS